MGTNPFSQVADALNQVMAKVIDNFHSTTKADFVLWPPQEEGDDGPVVSTAVHGACSFDDLVAGRLPDRGVVLDNLDLTQGDGASVAWHPRPDRQADASPAVDEVKDALGS